MTQSCIEAKRKRRFWMLSILQYRENKQKNRKILKLLWWTWIWFYVWIWQKSYQKKITTQMFKDMFSTSFRFSQFDSDFVPLSVIPYVSHIEIQESMHLNVIITLTLATWYTIYWMVNFLLPSAWFPTAKNSRIDYFMII